MSLPVVLIVDNVRSLHNIGSLFRIADAVALQEIWLCGLSAYPIKNKENFDTEDSRPLWVAERADKIIRKTGLSGVENVSWRYFGSTDLALKVAKEQSISIYGLEQTTKSQDYRKVKYNWPVAIVVGHEREGIEDSIIEKLDNCIEIPMHGAGKSLNVAVASAVLLYHLKDQYLK